MERSRTEISLFGAAIAGIYLCVWGVIFVNKWMVGCGVAIILFCLACFSLRSND